MSIKRKAWSKYTPAEIEKMRKAVEQASDGTPFSPEYAAAYLGISSSTLQHKRSHESNGISYSKIGGHVRYRKRHLDEYMDRCSTCCTA